MSHQLSHQPLFLKQLEIRRSETRILIDHMKVELNSLDKEIHKLEELIHEHMVKVDVEMEKDASDMERVREWQNKIRNYEDLLESEKCTRTIVVSRMGEEERRLLDTELMIMHVKDYDP